MSKDPQIWLALDAKFPSKAGLLLNMKPQAKMQMGKEDMAGTSEPRVRLTQLEEFVLKWGERKVVDVAGGTIVGTQPCDQGRSNDL